MLRKQACCSNIRTHMRLVIKIGTQVISGKTGLSRFRIKQVLEEIAKLLKERHEIILISSGAVGAGRPELPDLNIPLQKKVWAAVGQPMMINTYAEVAEHLKLFVAQVLILRENFNNRDSFTSMVNIVEALLASKILPILNENDTMKTENLTLGDNDILSAMVAVAFSAAKLIILTNQDGL